MGMKKISIKFMGLALSALFLLGFSLPAMARGCTGDPLTCKMLQNRAVGSSVQQLDRAYLDSNQYAYRGHAYRTTGRVFVFSPRKLRWYAYENGRLIRSGRASGGAGYCADVKRGCRTPVGNFSVKRKGPASCKSSKFPLGRGGAPMPYCMFFYHGFAIHGSYDVPNHNASHGCIRVEPKAAAWLSNHFMRIGTKVKVTPY